MQPRLSIIVPALDEACGIREVVVRALAEGDEVVVCDGGSQDATAEIAAAAGAVVVQSARGRGVQLDAGAACATGDLFLFLHADTGLPSGAGAAIRWAAAQGQWGCFAVRVESDDFRLRWCGRYMTARAQRTGSATGDMGIWCTRSLFSRVGGFGDAQVCEDLDLSRRLRAIAPGQVLPLRVATSARRWEAEGVYRTMLRMWAVRGAFYLGAPQSVLVGMYRGARG